MRTRISYRISPVINVPADRACTCPSFSVCLILNNQDCGALDAIDLYRPRSQALQKSFSTLCFDISIFITVPKHVISVVVIIPP